ncbi:MAG: CRISPR-associated protein Cas4 [Desulfomonilaceae bacterium]
MYEEDELLPISGLQHYVFCRRRAALIFLEQVWDENAFTAEGSIVHEKVHSAPDEWQRGLRVTRGLRLRSLSLGLIGQADVVELRQRSSAMGVDDAWPETEEDPLIAHVGEARLFPVEYKRGKARHEKSYEVQLCAQALCLEEMLQTKVDQGAIFYSSSGRRVVVTFDESLREMTRDAAQKFHLLIREGVTPRVRYERKCEKCSLLSLCLPRVTGTKRLVKRYLAASCASLGDSE